MSLFKRMGESQQWRVLAALGAVYLIWGSTYLAIRFAVETMPPFIMGGLRFLVAGAILYFIARRTGARSPSRVHWRSTAIIGALLLFGGNGGLTWAEQKIPSGTASLFISTVPLWMVTLHWLSQKGTRPSLGVIVGLVLGLAGISFLISPDEGSNLALNLPGVLMVLVAAFSWAVGSLYSRQAALPGSALLGTGMQMIMGGLFLSVAAVLLGEVSQVRVDVISARSLLAVAYLILVGSLVGFTCYIWLLKAAPPSLVSTYAFVNPVVAVFLGWALAGEPLTARTLVAAVFIILAVAMITFYQAKSRRSQDSQVLSIEREKSAVGEAAE